MRAPHRRDISARQDLLGKELRQLFDEYTQEDMPDELRRLAEALQGAVESRAPGSEKPLTEKAAVVGGAAPAPAVSRDRSDD